MDITKLSSTSKTVIKMPDKIPYSRKISLKNVLQQLNAEQNEIIGGVYIEPPERNSPENFPIASSGDEDQVPFYLNGEYLERRAEIFLANYRRTNSESTIVTKPNDTSEENDTPSSFPKPDYERFKNKTPKEIFELFFDDEVIDLILSETLHNSNVQNKDLSFLTPKEMRKFLAILLVSGYHKISAPLSGYWNCPDLRNALIANSMHHKRFQEIYEHISFEHRSEIFQTDRIWMLRPLMSLLQKRFVTNLPPEEIINFDECVVDSFRRYDCRGLRHIPFGYKVSCLNTPSGYLIDFYVHQRKYDHEVKYDTKFGAAAAPLLEMLDKQPEEIRKLPFKIYFGDLKTNTSFLNELKQRGYTSTGVFSSNALDKVCPFERFRRIENRNINKMEWVASAPFSNDGYYNPSENVFLSKVISNDTHYITTSWNRPHSSMLDANKCVINYRKSIIGTDTMNKHIDLYRIRICDGRKWYWPLFTWLLDVAVHNAWLLMEKANGDFSLIDFRREIVSAYLDENRDIQAKLTASKLRANL